MSSATHFCKLCIILFIQFYHLIIALQVLFAVVMNHFYKCLWEREEKLADFLLVFKIQIGFDLVSQDKLTIVIESTSNF